ncbi:MAG TPA: nuclear transport factor 2 family protein [Pseudonocardiaceae bacterium]|nr:nuclear transport factor 2 family protein [Pseudonocardiaceae bacterium]
MAGRDEELVRGVLAELSAAMKAGDAAAVVALYTADAVRFTLAPPLGSVGVAVGEFAAWLATFDGPVDYEIRDLAVVVGGELALCHSVNRLSATPLGMSEGFDLWFRSTVGLRLVDGSWRIAHEHTSTPFYMDGSFRAAVDLKP